ncbi:MAG: hypothetical protein ACTSYF_07885, partial [Promethearchaeota archaeon]
MFLVISLTSFVLLDVSSFSQPFIELSGFGIGWIIHGIILQVIRWNVLSEVESRRIERLMVMILLIGVLVIVTGTPLLDNSDLSFIMPASVSGFFLGAFWSLLNNIKDEVMLYQPALSLSPKKISKIGCDIFSIFFYVLTFAALSLIQSSIGSETRIILNVSLILMFIALTFEIFLSMKWGKREKAMNESIIAN